MQLYAGHGIRFRYPESWTIAVETKAREVSISVEDAGTAFWSISLYKDRPDPQEMLDAGIEAFREEYDDLDTYPVEKQLAGVPNVACDIEFVSLDMLNTAFLRAFRTAEFSAFVLAQATDRELAETRETLEAISASVICDLEVDPEI